MKNIFNTAILLFLFVLNSIGQDFEWLKSATVISGFNTASCSSLDVNANSYVVGMIQGSFDADFGDGEFIFEAVEPNRRMYVIKMDTDGNFIWAKQFLPSPLPLSNCYPFEIEIIGEDFLYIGGIFTGEIDFDPGIETELMSSATPDAYDGFTLALDGDGNFLWAHQYGDSSYDQVKGISTDTDGNLFVAGDFSGTVDFDQGPGVHLETTGGLSFGYLLKLNSDGDFQWVRVFSGTLVNSMQDVDISPLNEIYVLGTFRDTIDADPGIGEVNLAATPGTFSMITLKLDEDGNYIWSKKTDGIEMLDYPKPENILADSHSLYITSYCTDTLDLDPGPAEYKLYTGSGVNTFIQKLDNDGNFVWGKNMGGSSGIRSYEIKKNINNRIYVAGFISNGTIDLDPSEDTFMVTSPGVGLFIQEFNTSGDLKWAYGSDAFGEEIIRDFNIDSFGNFYFFGSNSNSILDFDFGPDVANLPYGDEIFLWKLALCDNEYVTLNELICNDYTVPSGDETYSLPGTYFDTIPYVYGCETFLTIIVSDFYESTSLEFDAGTFTAYPAGAEYAWIDCDNLELIAGENEQTFTPLEEGSYAAIITYGDCSDTTACRNTSDVGVDRIQTDPEIFIYPNPSNGRIDLTLSEPMDISIYSSVGILILRIQMIGGSHLIDLSELSSGMYIISAKSADGMDILTKKLVIQ